MGEMDSKQGGAPVLTELNVTIEETVSVHPEELCENTSPLFLSNLDMLEVQFVDSVHIYPVNPEIQRKETYSVADRIKKGLSKALVHYDILAGRFRVNEELKRLELHRNYAGVPFSTASCHALTLEDLGDLSTPKPFFRFFLPPRQNATKTSDIPLLIQVTTFKCGGFVLGLTNGHVLLDGLSFGELLINLLSLAQDGPLVIPPQFDQTMLRARENPHVNPDDPDHVEYQEFWNVTGAEEDQDHDSTILDHQLKPDHQSMSSLITQFFSFTAGDLVTLRRRATEGGVVSIASRFDALTSHIWQAYTRANESEPTQVSRLVYAVDVRNRMEPPLPKDFAGNATVSAFARYNSCLLRNITTKCYMSRDPREATFILCGADQKANKRITNDYVRSAIDYLQRDVGEESIEPDLTSLTTWAKLPFHSIEFDGKLPLYAGPTLRTCPKDIIIFPDFRSSNANGLNQRDVGEESIEPDLISLTTWAKLPFHSIEFDGKLSLYAGPTLRTCPKDIIIFPDFRSSNADGLNLLLTMNADAMGKFRKYVKVLDSIIETKLPQSFPQSNL